MIKSSIYIVRLIPRLRMELLDIDSYGVVLSSPRTKKAVINLYEALKTCIDNFWKRSMEENHKVMQVFQTINYVNSPVKEM